ncbi:MAG: hypothetical protein QOF33_1897 [Thermomicrobiales bacterium]|nr:hypothetical protein [Thermomicrobiales bacterium]MEA2598944.1 hypothetical protein [Thermomicrobiales bacterium]
MSYRIPRHVHARAIHDEVVVLNTQSDAYLGLNRTGSVIWQVVSQGGSEDEAVEALLDRFAVAREIALADVTNLVADLVTRGLLEPEST